MVSHINIKEEGIPTGDKQFMMNFPAANPNFNAASVSSLVISGSMAALEGAGAYNFIVTGVDSGDIRVQITDPSHGNTVFYETHPGAALTTTPTSTLKIFLNF